DKVVTRSTVRGTHQGPFLGIPATGKKVEVAQIDIWRLDGGKIVEHWGQDDRLGMLQQLGAVPQPEGVGA
ncbi:MAG: ester cyclase, partial [Chloroflexi bacterium]|nr:ester cyclase [Chloroflexota bacterium]